MTDDQSKLIQAVMMVSDIYISDADKVRIEKTLGKETLQALIKLYDDTIGCEVDWSQGSMDVGLHAVSDVLERQYAFLPDEAKHLITHWFMMVWK